MDWKAARDAKKLTLKEASILSGYKIPTINALELESRGSERLKSKLREIYGIINWGGADRPAAPDLQTGLIDPHQENCLWCSAAEERAVAAEKSLEDLWRGLDDLLKQSRINSKLVPKLKAHIVAGADKIHSRRKTPAE